MLLGQPTQPYGGALRKRPASPALRPAQLGDQQKRPAPPPPAYPCEGLNQPAQRRRKRSKKRSAPPAPPLPAVAACYPCEDSDDVDEEVLLLGQATPHTQFTQGSARGGGDEEDIRNADAWAIVEACLKDN